MAELSRDEIAKILEKIRTEYKEMSRTNPKVYNSNGFEDRYYQILKMRGNVEKFLNDEVQFLEILKKKHTEILEKQKAAKGETFDKIIAEQEEKLGKYSKIDFHPAAKKETRYFYGAMADFNDSFIPALEHIFRGTYEMNELKNSLIAVERIGLTKRGVPSVRIQQHIKLLLDANGNPSLIERESQNLLKEGCLGLKEIHDILLKIQADKLFTADRKMNLDERDHAKAFARCNARTFAEVVEETIHTCRGIIEDFRMQEITGLK